MHTHDDTNERRIVRWLDGELTSDQEAELQRGLLRDPAARRLAEAYRRIDVLASETLRAVVDRPSPTFRPIPAARRGMPWFRLGLLAAAAALTMAVSLELHEKWSIGRDDGRPVDAMPTSPIRGTGLRPVVAPYSPEFLHRRNRQVLRDTIVIQGDEPDRYYVVEQDRMRTVILPIGGEL